MEYGEKQAEKIKSGFTPEEAKLFAQVESGISDEEFRNLPVSFRHKIIDLTYMAEDEADDAYLMWKETPDAEYAKNSFIENAPGKVLFIIDKAIDDTPEQIAASLFKDLITKEIAEKAINLDPFYANSQFSYEVDWKKYSAQDLVKAAGRVDIGSILDAKEQIIAQRPDGNHILATAISNALADPEDAKNVFMYQREISAIPELNEKFYSKQGLDALTTIARNDPYGFLIEAERISDKPFFKPIMDDLVRTKPANVINNVYWIQGRTGAENWIRQAAQNDPVAALKYQSATGFMASARYLVKPEYLKMIDDAIPGALQPYLDKISANPPVDEKPELYVVNRLNTLHESPDAVRYDIIKNLNASGEYQLLTRGRSEIYTSTFNHIYHDFMDDLHKEGTSFEAFLHAKPDRMENLPAFLDAVSTFGQFGDFLKDIGAEGRDMITHTLMDDVAQNPLKMAAMAGYLKSVPNGDPTLELFESKLIDEYSKAKTPTQKDALGIMGRWYAENSGHAPSAGHAAQFDAFLKNDRYEMRTPSEVRPEKLFDAQKRHFQMHVFYNDEDGFSNYDYFKKNAAQNGWSISEDNKENIAHLQKKVDGRTTHIYATIPHESVIANNDEAVEAIQQKVADQGGKITFVAHRGHSYNVNKTLPHLTGDEQILYLGACGGTNFIDDALKESPNASIIATAGIGTRFVNEPLMNAINSRIVAGKPVVWNDIGDFVDTLKDERATYYEMPDQNLQAIFARKMNDLKETDTKKPVAENSLTGTFSATQRTPDPVQTQVAAATATQPLQPSL